MRALIIYSSRTGNTKTIAEAIAEGFEESGLNFELHPVEAAPSADAFDLLCLGYWVDKGVPDEKLRNYMAGVSHKQIALFGTLGAYPDSDHARECIAKSEEMARRDGVNKVLGSFLCMGKVDPKIIEMMRKVASGAHPMTPERLARIEEAKKHPDAEDCRRAREAFSGFARSALSARTGAAWT